MSCSWPWRRSHTCGRFPAWAGPAWSGSSRTLMGCKRCASHTARGPCAWEILSGVQPREEAPPMEYIAFDAHKHYTLASVVTPDGQLVREERIEHDRGTLREFLERCERGSPVAVETIGNWYWIIDEIEAAGCLPRLVHARKAKLMMGEIN